MFRVPLLTLLIGAFAITGLLAYPALVGNEAAAKHRKRFKAKKRRVYIQVLARKGNRSVWSRHYRRPMSKARRVYFRWRTNNKDVSAAKWALVRNPDSFLTIAKGNEGSRGTWISARYLSTWRNFTVEFPAGYKPTRYYVIITAFSTYKPGKWESNKIYIQVVP